MPQPGRHEEGARTRERVLEAAATLIATHGYAATSIARIGKAAGANSASIYWAFGSKEGLFAAVMERAADTFYAELRLPEAEDPWQFLRGLAAAFEGGPEFLRLLLVLSLERRDGSPEVLEAARRVRRQAAGALAAVYAEHLQIRDPSPRRRICRELARFTLMLFDGVFVASQIEPDETHLKREFETIALAVQATGERLIEEAAATKALRRRRKKK